MSATNTNSLYMVLFIGEIRNGVKPSVLKESIAKTFNVSIIRIDKLFTGRPEVIKNNASKELADRYCEVMQSLGAVSWVVPMPPFYGKYIDRRKNIRTRRQSVATRNEYKIRKGGRDLERRVIPGRRYHDK